eukprot:gene10540-3060_t
MFTSGSESEATLPYLEVELIEGKNLAIRDSNGKSDPFVIFRTPNSKVKSKTIMKNLNPVWNQKLTVPLTRKLIQEKGVLEVECWDYDFLSSNDFMGCTKVELDNLEDGKISRFEKKLDLVESGTQLNPMAMKRMASLKSPEEIILEKLKNSRGKKLDQNSLQSWSRNLSDPERLKDTYLATNWVDSLEMQKKIDEIKDEEEQDNDTKNTFPIDPEEEENEQEEEITQKFSKELKIKLLFVDHMKDDNFQNNIRKLISPVISEIGDYSKFGLFHTALLIGPWLLEWTDSALCIPRKCVSKAAFLTADVGEITTKESLESIRDKLAKVIIDWNVNYGYTTISMHKKNAGNCQDFLDSIFLELGLEFKFEGALGEFIKSLKKNGTAKLKYPVSDEIKTKFDISENEIEFKTHQELDIFVKKLFKKDFTFDLSYKGDYNLLKSFDRAFWLKHLKCRNELRYITNALALNKEKYIQYGTNALKTKIEKIESDLEFQNSVNEFSKPYEDPKREKIEDEDEEDETDCPFGHPAATRSFW